MSDQDRKTLGLIGFGQFGRLAASVLEGRFDVVVHDCRDVAADAAVVGVRVAAFEEVAAAPVVVVAVPVQAMADVFREMAPHLAPGALVVDVGSVKVVPLRWMREALPEHVEIVGTHPMFGPQSVADGQGRDDHGADSHSDRGEGNRNDNRARGEPDLRGQRIAVCAERTRRLVQVRDYLEGLGLVVIECTAEEHDRQVAWTQAVAQYVGRALSGVEGADYPIRTPAADALHEAARTVGNDSWELFCAIQNLNPYAAESRNEMRRRLAEIDAGLAEADADGGDG